MSYKEKFGPWAIVTGASDGIGKAVAIDLATRGLNLILVSRQKNRLDELAKEIGRWSQVQIEVLPLDLSKAESSTELFDFSKKFDVGLFAAVAGFGTSGPLIESNIEAELNMVDVNCRAVVAQCFRFGKLFAEKKRGGIILMSSIVAFQGVPHAANYSATKAFIQSLAEGLHYELKPFGISVLASAPGPVASGFAHRANMQMGQAATPEEVGRATVAALGHCLTVRPGFLSKFLGWSLQTMNRWGRIQIMRKIMEGMTRQKLN